MKLIKECFSCIDTTSIKLNLISLIGFMSHDDVIFGLTSIATLSTIAYNSINIYRYFTKKRKS